MATIDRCVCRDRTFESLKKVARENGVTNFESLQQFARFGDNCQLCHPYVREMLRTGQVSFSQILTGSAFENCDIDIDVKPEKKVD